MTAIIPDNSTSEFRIQPAAGDARNASLVAWRVTEDGAATPIFWPALQPGDILQVRRGPCTWEPIDPATGRPVTDVAAGAKRNAAA